VAVALIALVAAACLPAPNARTTSPDVPSASGPAVATSAPSARSSATPKPQVAAMAAFVANAAGGKWSYRMAFKGTLRAAADTVPVTGTTEVAGADYATTITYDFRRDYPSVGRVRVQVRGVRGHGYRKTGSAAWRSAKAYASSQSFVPFRSVRDVNDVQYAGEVEVDGSTLFKVAIPGAILIHPNTVPALLQKEKIRVTELEVVIDSKGRPRSGTWTMWGTGRVGVGVGQLQEIVYELDLAFAKVGSKLSIKRP
jgi:hypothetical protein